MTGLFDIDFMIVQELCKALDIKCETRTIWVEIRYFDEECYCDEKHSVPKGFGIYHYRDKEKLLQEKSNDSKIMKEKSLFVYHYKSSHSYYNCVELVSSTSDVWKLIDKEKGETCGNSGDIPEFYQFCLDDLMDNQSLVNHEKRISSWWPELLKCNVCEKYSLCEVYEDSSNEECKRGFCSGELEYQFDLETDIPHENKIKLEQLWQMKEQIRFRENVQNQFKTITELLDRPGMPGACATWLDHLEDMKNDQLTL